MPKAFLLGIVNQMILLPAIAFLLARSFGLPAALAVGFMVLALSPGGVTTNVLTKIAQGNTALSISLTAVVTLVSVITVPVLVAWSVGYFMSASAPVIDTAELSKKMIILTLAPVLLGLFVNQWAPKFAASIVPWLSKLAVGLFAGIIGLAIWANKDALLKNIDTLGPAVIVLMLAMLAIGLLTGTVFGLDAKDKTTIAIETGIQNGTLGIAVAAILASQILSQTAVGQSGSLTAFALPSAVYGAVMYLIGIPFVLWRRKKSIYASQHNPYGAVHRLGRLSIEPKPSGNRKRDPEIWRAPSSGDRANTKKNKSKS